eukprot:8860122-Lingulodinium_polyedra.AAC.1
MWVYVCCSGTVATTTAAAAARCRRCCSGPFNATEWKRRSWRRLPRAEPASAAWGSRALPLSSHGQARVARYCVTHRSGEHQRNKGQ